MPLYREVDDPIDPHALCSSSACHNDPELPFRHGQPIDSLPNAEWPGRRRSGT